MKAGIIMIMATALLVAGCGGGDVVKNEVVAPAAPKTVLTDEQFAEVKANCNLGDAELSASTSTKTTTDEEGLTSTQTTTYDGPADQKTIVLSHVMSDEEVVQIKTCLKGEFERLGAEARLQPPRTKGL
jgi:hypothetical protein